MKTAEIQVLVEWDCPYVRCQHPNAIIGVEGSDVIGEVAECEECHRKSILSY